MSAFSVELVFRVAGREVGPDNLMETLVSRVVEQLRPELQRVATSHDAAVTPTIIDQQSEPRAVGIDRAAELFGLRKFTVRKWFRVGSCIRY